MSFLTGWAFDSFGVDTILINLILVKAIVDLKLQCLYFAKRCELLPSKAHRTNPDDVYIAGVKKLNLFEIFFSIVSNITRENKRKFQAYKGNH